MQEKFSLRLMKTGLALGAALLVATTALAQSPAPPKGPPPTAKSGAYFDITGYWVSVVTEDWVYRMILAPKGDAGSLPVNPEGRKAAEGFDPAADKAKGEECRMNGAAGNIRRPGRLHISWADDSTLKMQFSAGDQTRLLQFGAPKDQAPSWQGVSHAGWTRVRNWQQFGPPAIAPVGGTLKVDTTNMRPGYLQANGFPYSATTKMTEYYDRIEYQGTPWLIVTTVIEDPVFLRDKLYWTTPFRQEANGAAFKIKPCGEI
jgi:hypothetical protein